jgi:MFS transporter, DHA1 family, inner membrane transport protein
MTTEGRPQEQRPCESTCYRRRRLPPMRPQHIPAHGVPRRVLPTIVLAQLLGTSPWFAVNAVMPDLQRQFAWPAAALGTLSSALQLGFVAGTLVFALLAVADRWPARRVFLLCTLAASASTLLAAAMTLNATTSAGAFNTLLFWRALTGFCLAGIYPVGMKIAAQWFPTGLGGALGWLLAALVLGSASPHALRWLGAGWPWVLVFVAVALAAAVGGLLLTLGVPEPPGSAVAGATGLRLGALRSIVLDPRLRASAGGYFGHMFELYSVWVLMPMILATRWADAQSVSLWAFVILGAGAIGCIGGGWLAPRWGSAKVAGAQLATSGLCCLAAPWALHAPLPVFMLWLVIWGVTVAGDSPQFSALTAANAPPGALGSVLTLVNCIGFAISVVSIALFVRLSQSLPLAALLPALALGPVLGMWALRGLSGQRRSPAP